MAVDKQFSPERARKVMRADIADYYAGSIKWLEPKISQRPNYVAMRELLEVLSKKMNLDDDQEPTLESIKEIRKISTQLMEFALKRQQ
ncbi:MAG: hypothetical protein EOP02_34700 [Proteobacteria bacterium]|nr:MAG: hypothetical protein EOP02_34700 [Pseudomonadota bacterium]